MFGIGAGEMVIIFFVLLIAVGPDKMPTFLKSVGKGVREFRRTTRELRHQVGIDDLLKEDPLELNKLKDELSAPLRDVQRSIAGPGGAAAPVNTSPLSAARGSADAPKYMSEDALVREQPAAGPDVHFAEAAAASAAEATVDPGAAPRTDA